MSSAAFPPTTFFQGSWGSEIESNHFFIAGEGGVAEAIHMLGATASPVVGEDATYQIQHASCCIWWRVNGRHISLSQRDKFAA
uniref:Uncharacterized protein n=1 Tax=Oryza barthii TaxID=65489 RepID=A0A0D3FTD7_9ORYZ